MHKLPYLQCEGNEPIYLENRLAIFGSDPKNPIVIKGEKVQAHHGYVVFKNGGFWARSLCAEHPVLINGQPANEEEKLKDSDLLRIGNGSWKFVDPFMNNSAHETDASAKAMVFEAIAAILESNGFHDASQRLVQSVGRIFRCDGVALVRTEEDEQVSVIASFPVEANSSRFSHYALEQARINGKTMLLYPSDLGSEASISIAENNISSVLCAPLMLGDDLIGFLYMDRISGRDSFQVDDQVAFEAVRKVFSLLMEKLARIEEQSRQVKILQEQDQVRAGILGQSSAMLKALEQASAIAKASSPVFVHGETGTGKELFAKYIHQHSPVAQGPFVAINCGAIAANLIESEMFGHEKGAFTGAHEAHEGWIEQAHGGTLFLDEIGELDLPLQTRLLRVLQEGEVVRVGGRAAKKVDFRIVSASHRELKELVRQGRFREDLFYRVHVIGIELPPLRERGDDLLMLAHLFLQRQSAQLGRVGLLLGKLAEKAIMAHAWPGNVRELQNAIQRAAILCNSKIITPEDLGLPSRAELVEIDDGAFETLQQSRDNGERSCAIRALKRSRGNVSLAAKLADIDRKAFIRVLERLGIEAGEFK